MTESYIIIHHVTAVFAYPLTSCLWQRILSSSTENGQNLLYARSRPYAEWCKVIYLRNWQPANLICERPFYLFYS